MFRKLTALATLLVTLVLFGGVQPAGADSTAATDDKSLTVQTDTWYAKSKTKAQIQSLLSTNGARVTDLEPVSTSANTFAVVMVRNVGAFAAPTPTFDTDRTFAQVSAVANNGARLIDLDAYDDGGVIRFSYAAVANTGSAARSWIWGAGSSRTAMRAALGLFTTTTSDDFRLIDLETYTERGVKKYAYIAVANTRADYKQWEADFDKTSAGVTARVNAFGGRITALDRQDDGTYNVVLVKNAGADNKVWGIHFGLSSLTRADEVARQYGNRIFDIETYTVNAARSYDMVELDNADAETRRITSLVAPTFTAANGLPIGNFGFYLKAVGARGYNVALGADRRIEPASAIKAVVNLDIMRRAQSYALGINAYLGQSVTWWNYPNSPYNPASKDACTIASDEINANKMTSTRKNVKDLMMSESNNPATRAFMLLYGLPALNTTAATAGMADTLIQQDHPGCAWIDGKRNWTTLVDLGRLYEGVENGTLLGSSARTEFYAPMSGGAFDGATGVEAAVRAVVANEANKLSLSSNTVTAFIAGMSWRFKPGGYSIGCTDPLQSQLTSAVGCTSGYLLFNSRAGQLTLPTKTSTGAASTRRYVFGRYTDSYASPCFTTTTSVCATDATMTSGLATLDAELFRSVIRAALQTW